MIIHLLVNIFSFFVFLTRSWFVDRFLAFRSFFFQQEFGRFGH